jgi:hypothetical protein
MQSSPDDPAAAELSEAAEALRRELERLGAIEGSLAAMERELARTRREARSAVAICIVLIAVLLAVAFLVTR